MKQVVSPTTLSKKYPQGVEQTTFEVKRHLTDLNGEAKIPHPYFGHVYNRAFDHRINRDGFHDRLQATRKNKHSYRVGIFGGSVAKIFALHEKRKIEKKSPNLVSRLKKHFPQKFSGKSIELLNFGVSAYKQPQQFFVSASYIDDIDLAIIIDGFNEIYGAIPVEYSMEYPNYTNVFYSLDPERYRYWLQAYDSIRSRISWTLFALNGFIVSKLHTTKAVWEVYNYFVENQLKQINAGVSLQLDRENEYYGPSEHENLKKNESFLQAKVWSKYASLMGQMFLVKKIKHFHFLQPNQHLAGSKPLSNLEKKSFFNPDSVQDIESGYREIFQQKELLLKEGIKIYDLTKIFRDTEETLYTDPCCHFNYKGNEIMEDEIFKVIIRGF